MKITVFRASKFALLCTLLAGALLTFSPSARAVTLQIGDAHELGLVNNDGSSYVNRLIRMHNDFDRTPQAVLADNVNNGYAGATREVMTIREPAIIGRVPPGGTGTPVPDGGTTAILLGAALSVLGIVRRYMMS
jgi:protein with PEP-CTERM/exosortase system signal